jgi:hypothetical protein
MAWKRRLLEYDPVLKRQTWFEFDEHEMKQRLVETWDVRPIIEDNKRKYAATDERAGWKGDMHRIASVPLPVAHEWMKKTNNGKDQKAVAKLLCDPDNRYFLTRPVKL